MRTIHPRNTESVAEVTGFLDLLLRDAPKDFTPAIACLIDGGVAEKAYEVIFRCQRRPFFLRSGGYV